MNLIELTALDRALPRGRDCATSIPALVAHLGLSDRYIREGLEQLVNGEAGHRVAVVTLPTNPGVFVATSPAELDLGDAHLRAKAMSLLHRRRSLRLCREYLAYRPTLFDL
jgi:hypothetical protein